MWLGFLKSHIIYAWDTNWNIYRSNQISGICLKYSSTTEYFSFFKKENKDRQAYEKHNPYLLSLWIQAHTGPSSEVCGRGSHRSLQGRVTSCMGTHGETASCWIHNPQQRLGQLSGWWEGRRRTGPTWGGQTRGSQPQPSVPFNLIPWANPKQVPTEHAIWNTIMHSWQ